MLFVCHIHRQGHDLFEEFVRKAEKFWQLFGNFLTKIATFWQLLDTFIGNFLGIHGQLVAKLSPGKFPQLNSEIGKRIKLNSQS